ncbi:MAG: type II secretion system protein [Burkholderiales bacterium]
MRRQSGHALAIVLFLAFVTAILIAALARLWSLDLQRDKERDLMWIGRQFRTALGSYAATTPEGHAPFPKKLDELVEDKRLTPPMRHLRRIYVDPMTHGTDWGIVRAEDGTIRGVYSTSDAAPLKNDTLSSFGRMFEGAKRYSDWRFEVSPLVVREVPLPVEAQ